MLFNLRRELIIVSLAGAIVIMGLGFILPLFPIYVSQKGANHFELGLIVSAFTISQFFVQPFFGGLSDRIGRKPFMIGGLVCYGLVAALFIFAQTLPQIFMIRMLHGVGAGMIWPAMAAYIIDQSPVEKRGEAMGLLSAIEMMGFAIGPVLGGLLYGLGGMDLPFLGCTLLAFISAALVWVYIHEAAFTPSTVSGNWWERYGFSSLRLRDIRLLCLIGLGEAYIWGTFMTMLPIMASSLAIPPTRIGWLFSLFFIAYVCLQGPVGKWSDRSGRKRPIILGTSIYAGAMLLLNFGGDIFYMMGVLAIAGAGVGIYSPSVRVAIADLSSDEVRGANMGFFFTTRMVGFFLGPNLSGILADHFGLGLPFLVGAAVLGIGILASFYLSPVLSRGMAGMGASGRKEQLRK